MIAAAWRFMTTGDIARTDDPPIGIAAAFISCPHGRAGGRLHIPDYRPDLDPRFEMMSLDRCLMSELLFGGFWDGAPVVEVDIHEDDCLQRATYEYRLGRLEAGAGVEAAS
jgi:hypothetical protein